MNIIMSYAEEHWPVVIFLIGAVGSGAVWLKHALIDDVYATKEEMNVAILKLEKDLMEHEKKVDERYTEIRDLIGENHDEIKDLIITRLWTKN